MAQGIFDKLCWIMSARCIKFAQEPETVTADEPLRVQVTNHWMSTEVLVTVFHRGAAVAAHIHLSNHFEPKWLSTWLVRHDDDEFRAMVACVKSEACKADTPGLWPALSQHVDRTDTSVLVCAVAHSLLVWCRTNTDRLVHQ